MQRKKGIALSKTIGLDEDIDIDEIRKNIKTSFIENRKNS